MKKKKTVNTFAAAEAEKNEYGISDELNIGLSN